MYSGLLLELLSGATMAETERNCTTRVQPEAVPAGEGMRRSPVSLPLRFRRTVAMMWRRTAPEPAPPPDPSSSLDLRSRAVREFPR
jgi:hypothetical protein